jgi:hypothetical protein
MSFSRIITTFIFSFLGGILFSQQNLKENFTPLKSEGVLPEIFTQNIRNIIKADITDLNKSKEKDKTIKTIYLTEANFEIEKIVKSGNTLINDEITKYLNKLKDIVLSHDANLRSKLNIFTLKSTVVNAYSYDKGYIFFDVGLIAQAESEAQLAYILCHEISHYTKHHNIQGYVKNRKLEKEVYEGKSTDDILVEKCQYSKENESEADLEGFKLFEATNYNFIQAQKAFDVLQYAHLPFELIEFKKTFLETENFKLPAGYFLKEVSSIRNNGADDDTKSTHPNTVKRKAAIEELIKSRSNDGRVNNVAGEDQFKYIRDLARFESCRLYLKNRDYPNALYAAYILKEKYPDNKFVAEVIAKCLYALTLYKKGDLRYGNDSYLESGFPSYSNVESYPQQIYHLIEKMPENEWAVASLNYTYRAHKKFPNDSLLDRLSDSLFHLMGRTNWGIVDFVRTNRKEVKKEAVKDTTSPKSKTELIANLQKENNFKNYDTAYYKDAFVDLFMTDKEFVTKFPTAGQAVSSSAGFNDYRPRSYSSSKKAMKKGNRYKEMEKVSKVITLEPFYVIIDNKENTTASVEADEKQETLINTINSCAGRQNFELVTLDPGLITASDVSKMNDYSIINDWIYERFDGYENSNGSIPIFGTDEIKDIIKKYGTTHILKTGIGYVKGKRKYTVFYAAIYDLKTNKMVYLKQEVFKGKPNKDLINAKMYQMFYELKNG